jgi:hypothetical protein
MDVKSTMDSFLHGIEWIMFHDHLVYFQKPPLGDKPNTKPGDHGSPNAHNRKKESTLSNVRTRMIKKSLK